MAVRLKPSGFPADGVVERTKNVRWIDRAATVCLIMTDMQTLTSTQARSALAVANEFIAVAKECGNQLTPMQLLKLVFFAHGWHLVIKNEPLVQERFEAWKFGPVVPDVYYEFKQFRDKPITGFYSTIEQPAQSILFGSDDEKEQVPRVCDSFQKALIKRIYEVYSPLSGPQMSALTHRIGSSWYKAWEDRDGKNRPGTDLIDEEIKADFPMLKHA
jgi:uncharacterized phage-associated protein